MFEPYEVTKRITVEDVYGTSNPPIPDGMRAKESRLRMPLKGEKYLSPFGTVLTAGDNHRHEDGDRPRIILAPVLNDWQILYGEGIPDAAALEAKLRAEGKLAENQFIEAELRPVDRDLWFVSKDPDICVLRSHGPLAKHDLRAIVGTRKRRYLKVPLDGVWSINAIAPNGTMRCVYLRPNGNYFPEQFGAEIVEE